MVDFGIKYNPSNMLGTSMYRSVKLSNDELSTMLEREVEISKEANRHAAWCQERALAAEAIADEATRKLRVMSDRVEYLEAEILMMSKKDRCKPLEEELRTLNITLKTTQEELSVFKSKYEQLEKQNNDLKREIETFNSSISQLNSELGNKNSRLSDMESEYKIRTQEWMQIKDEYEKTNRLVQETRKSLMDRDQDFDSIQKLSQNTATLLQERENLLKQLESDIKIIRDENRELHLIVDGVQKELRMANSDSQDKHLQIIAQSQEIEDLESQVIYLNRRLQEKYQMDQADYYLIVKAERLALAVDRAIERLASIFRVAIIGHDKENMLNTLVKLAEESFNREVYIKRTVPVEVQPVIVESPTTRHSSSRSPSPTGVRFVYKTKARMPNRRQ